MCEEPYSIPDTEWIQACLPVGRAGRDSGFKGIKDYTKKSIPLLDPLRQEVWEIFTILVNAFTVLREISHDYHKCK